MLTENLFDEILVRPVRDGATELLIVSGYAGATMAYRHLGEPQITDNQIRVRLVVGMAVKDGVRLADHDGFRMLEAGGLFECHYRIDQPATHSKVYVWLAHDTPMRAFVGSANYTQIGFGIVGRQQEAMAQADPMISFNYFEQILRGSMEVSHDDIDQHITLHRGNQKADDHDDYMTIPLYSIRTGEVQNTAGLNWGFRQQPGYNRNLNEAYIQIGAQIGRTDFFPARPTRFWVNTDDGAHFIAVRAQKSAGGDAIETPENNALLGEYFRNRMGLADGEFITLAHLNNYGRTNVRFCKTDDDEFLMDFSV